MWDINVDHNWWHFTYEDAKDVGLKINGFDLDRGAYVEIELLKDIEDVAQLIRDTHGVGCDTRRAAEHYIQERTRLVEKYSDGIQTDTVTQENECDFDNEADDLDEEFKKELSECYLTILRKEYDYLTSREAIIETIEANEYEFTEDGELY